MPARNKRRRRPRDLYSTFAKTGTFGGYKTFRPTIPVPGMEKQFLENHDDANFIPGQPNAPPGGGFFGGLKRYFTEDGGPRLFGPGGYLVEPANVQQQQQQRFNEMFPLMA